MVKHAENIGQGIDMLRIDFFITDSGPVFGEFTSYPDGCRPLVQSEFERLMGDHWKLPLEQWKTRKPFNDDGKAIKHYD